MKGLRRTWSRRTAQIAAAGLLAASGSMFFASSALAAAGGNNGTVLINDTNITNGNDPHLSCPVVIKWSGFDAAPPAPGNHYDVTFTGIAPTGGTISVVAPSDPTSADFMTSGTQATFSLSSPDATPNKKGEIHVNITVATTSSHATDTKSKTVWLQSCAVTPPVVTPASATANADCNALSAHLVAASNADTTFDIVHNNVTEHVTVPQGQTQDVTYGSGPNETITVSANGTQLDSKTSSSSCGGNPGSPTPASASANADCTALTAHLDGGTTGATFTVTEPAGTHSVVVGPGATQDVSYGSGNGAVITVKNGATVLDTASAPTNCTGAADPQVSEANHCVSGMNLTLSNMNGTADETFTVVEPDGTTEQVLVRAGQLKKLAFAVEEDTTGTLSVTAPGLAKQSFAYHKNCATVLGVKHIRKPTQKPPTVVKGEHAQLPFTGFDTKRAMLDGAVVFFLGAVLCILGARRKEEEPLYY